MKKIDCTHQVQNLGLSLNEVKYSGIKYNIENDFFGQTEMEYLGFWVTHKGVIPLKRKTKQ